MHGMGCCIGELASSIPGTAAVLNGTLPLLLFFPNVTDYQSGRPPVAAWPAPRQARTIRQLCAGFGSHLQLEITARNVKVA